jgi:UDP-N-acetylglucosamine pyrophosphorylase
LTKKQELTQIEQAEQDEITLDYEKWQARQIQANLPSHYVLWSEECDAVLQRQRIDKETAQQNRLNNLKVERRAKSRESESAINLELTTEMNRLRSQWLMDNPNKTEADFEKVRSLFRELLVEQLYTDALNEQIESLNKKP